MVTPAPGVFPAEELFGRIDAEFSTLVARKGLRLIFHYPVTGIALFSDQTLLLSMLGNLIGNAINYTENGGILVAVRRRGDRGLIQVWDTGIGVAVEHQVNIFEEYFQVDNTARDRTKGLGLGLSIVKRLAGLLKSEVRCRSRLGRGSVFELSLPLADAPAMLETAQGNEACVDSNAIERCRIVIVDDDPIVAEALELSLMALGMSVSKFANAEVALANPDIANADFYVSDFRLPGLNGLQFLDAVQERASSPITAVLLTGDASPSQIKSAKQSLWTVLFKPATLAEILSALTHQRAGR